MITDAEIDKSQRKLEALFPIHWLMEGCGMRTTIGDLMVSTVPYPFGGYETMVFRVRNGRVDWSELFCARTPTELGGHDEGISFATQSNSEGTTDAET